MTEINFSKDKDFFASVDRHLVGDKIIMSLIQ